jgi:hypothetical protein
MTATTRRMDFRNVKEAGNFRPRRKPEGEYKAKIVKVDDHTSKSDSEGWVFTVQIDGDKRSTYPIYVASEAKQAWKARSLAVACGATIGKKIVNFNPNTLVGKTLGVVLTDDEYEGRMKSTIDEWFPVEDLQGRADEDPDDDEEELEEDEDEDEEEPPPPPKRKRKPAPPPPPDDDEDEDDDEEEEDEEEPPPPPVKKKRKAPPAPVPAAKKRRKKVVEEDDEELDLEEL